MGRTKRVGIVILVMLGLSVAYCQHFWFPYTWHQKMTLEVEVDGQLYSGSSVVKVHVGESDPMTKLFGFPLQFGARGEAAFVELPGKRFLFALLEGGPPDSGPQTNALNIFKDQLPRKGMERFAILSKSRLKTDIPRSHYPLLVAFMDITDSKTIKVLDPGNLAATFGPGVLLKRVTLEITDQPVTRGSIEQVLPWFYRTESLIPSSEKPPFAKDRTPEQKISLLDFVDGKTFREKRIDNKK